MTELLEDQLRRLRLSGMAHAISVRLHEAEAQDLSCRTFLEGLITDELNRRISNLSNRRLSAAKLPFCKTIADFDFGFNPEIKKREILELMTCRCILEQRNVLLIGPPGVGKTHISVALALSAIEKGYEALYCSIFDLLEDLSLAIATGKRAVIMKKLIHTPLLIIDEFGMKRIPNSLAEELLELFHRRYGHHCTVICTNRLVDDWGKSFSDLPTATAILDRFLDGAHLLKLKGRSYRLQGDKKATREKEEDVPCDSQT